MKKIICLLLSLLMAMTVLTSCDYVASILDNLDLEIIAPQITTTEVEVTTPEVTTPEVTTPEEPPVEPQINYGSFINPVTTTYAYNVCANLANGESSAEAFYVMGTVTAIGTTGNYYKNVYFTDGETEMLIYTINMFDGITGFEVGDTITAYGYIKNYNGTIEMATYNGSEYVYVVRVESGNSNPDEVTTPEPEVTTPEPEVTTPEPDVNPDEPLHTDFTVEEKELFNNTVGLVIPFIPNNEYYVEEYEISGTNWLRFYTKGNTQAEFEAYLELFSSYNFIGTTDNENGSTWYLYSNGDVYVDLTYHYLVADYIVDVFVRIPNEDDDVIEHIYSGFNIYEEEFFNSTVGLVIPFIPNDEYYVEETEIEDSIAVNFYTVGNTQAEFWAYLNLFSSYTFDGTYVDEYDDVWYLFSSGNVCIEVSYYHYDGNYFVDVYVYIPNENEDDDVTDPVEPEINYGTINNPVTTTDAYNACADLANGESSAEAFYVRGTVTAIGTTGSYYKNVYFTDGTTEMLIYTINMPEGIDGFEVGDTIVAYGYIKNYNGIIEMATYNGSVYVYVVAVESENNNQGGTDTSEHLYTDFTDEEKELFNNIIGLVIPFIPNNEYYVEEYEEWDGSWLRFCTVGNTQAEFEAYLKLFSSYNNDGVNEPESGDTWYLYSNGNVCVDISYSNIEGNYVVDVYVYLLDEDEDEDVTEHLYNNFTAEDEAFLNDIVGLVIPFVPNDEYHIGEAEIAGGRGVNFCTLGNTQAEFEAYLDLFSSYSYDGTATDDHGYTWYFFSKNNVFVDVTYYSYEDSYVIDVFAYVLNENVTEHLYTDFTEEEKALFNNVVGILVPFIPNDQYVVEKYNRFGDNCVHFITVGNTQEEYEAYLELFSSFAFDGTRVDEYGDTWHLYSSGNIYIDVTYYFYNENYILDLYVYIMASGEDTEPSDFLYTDFTEEEKELFNEIVGFVVPFLPNDQYFVKNYQSWNEIGIVFYTLGNTESDFNNYLPILNSSYTFIDTTIDDADCIWYNYSNGEAFISLTHYMYEGVSYSVIEVYLVTSDWTEEEWDDPSIELLPNDGKGLPEDADGVYDVDFTKGKYVQNVSDQKYYSDGCPTTGSPAVLVIPVEFSDITAQSKGYTIENLEQIFYGNNLSYYSLYDYFRISSQNQLTLDITVVDAWFRPANSSSYYKEMSASHPNENEQELGTQLIIDEALAYLATFMDLSKFDSDNNGYIDAVVLVYTAEIDSSDNFHWAYRYWNWYKDESGAPYKYDDVSANDYVWISYEFMFEAYDEEGYLFFDQSNPLNPYTFIHEFSHILGANDYYDTSNETTVLKGLDIMDSTMGDHNPYTKFNYGWITTSKLIVTDSTLTINLEAFAKNGDTIILANNWDETLGAYQEYYIIMYYTMTGLNAGDGGYFDQNAILVYHINATLLVEYDELESPYIVYNNNTSVGPGSTRNNLIEFVISGDEDYIYTVGETLPTTTDDSGNELIYTFIVDAITEEYATITFTKK